LGWRLSAGGRITRIVKSLPDDDIDYGWCSVFWQARENWTPRQWINFLFDGGTVGGYIGDLLEQNGIYPTNLMDLT
jgi:hypothetical protein